MNKKDPTQLRIDLARGHWSLGEHEEAVACIERALSEVPDPSPLMVLIGTMLDDVSAEPVVERLIAVRDRVLAQMETRAGFELGEPMSTPTMAQLLAAQGHAEQARAVAEDALRKDPENERARAVRDSLAQPAAPPAAAAVDGNKARTIATLERWLAAAQRRMQRKANA